MNRITQFIIFFTVFFGLYTLLNTYVIFRYGTLFRVSARILAALVILAVISVPLSMFIENRFPNIITKLWYTASTLWMGIGLFFIVCLVIYEIVSRVIPVSPIKAGIVIGVIVILLSAYSIFNATQLAVKEVDVPIKGLSKEVKLVQVSDIHVGTIRNSGWLKEIAQKINDIDPDIVMITGDLVDASAPLHKSMFSGFNSLRAPVYFVTGNHETYEGVDKVIELFNDTKIQPLSNEVVTWDGIQIVGVDFSTDKTYLKNVLSTLKINQSKPAVLMYHPPMSMDDAKNAGIDLQVSGHTHYGQIYPFNFAVQMVFPKIRGLYDLDGMYLYVSPGTGTWGPYMRFGSKNEITVLNLVKE